MTPVVRRVSRNKHLPHHLLLLFFCCTHILRPIVTSSHGIPMLNWAILFASSCSIVSSSIKIWINVCVECYDCYLIYYFDVRVNEMKEKDDTNIERTKQHRWTLCDTCAGSKTVQQIWRNCLCERARKEILNRFVFHWRGEHTCHSFKHFDDIIG